ncbi:MAG: hypothetical protein HYX93_02230 [Chloroflexi bacterium]|nr:hypothetical protein [Chloroflexota bacterium]
MSPQLPGFNVSVLRQRTSAPPNEPVTMSGRVSAFGFGIPALVRVFVEGPAHNPEVRTFDTVAAPITGDYSIAVLVEKEGSYLVYAQAFPPVGLPLPGGAEPILLGPPLAESPRPPLIIGQPVNGRVEFEVAPGQWERVAPPAPTLVEVVTSITVVPRITVPSPPARVVAPIPAAPPSGRLEPPAAVTMPAEVSGRIAGFEIE